MGPTVGGVLLGDGRGTREIAPAIGLSPRATRTRLTKLVARGLVGEVGPARGTPSDPMSSVFRVAGSEAATGTAARRGSGQEG